MVKFIISSCFPNLIILIENIKKIDKEQKATKQLFGAFGLMGKRETKYTTTVLCPPLSGVGFPIDRAGMIIGANFIKLKD